MLRVLLITLLSSFISLSNLANATSGTPTLYYFLDTHRNLTIEDFLRNPSSIQFRATTDDLLAIGFSQSPVWLRLQFTPDNVHNILKLDSFLLQQIDWYERLENTDDLTPLQHKKIQHPNLHSNSLHITPGVNSTVWVRLTSNSAMYLSAKLLTASTDQLARAHNLNLLVFAITLSLGFVGVILHTQSQQQRLSLLPLQSLLLVCSGLSLPTISALGYTEQALTGGVLLTFLMHLHHRAREQPWWSVRQLRIVRGILIALLITNCWPQVPAPLTSTLLLTIGMLTYALWVPFAHMQVTSSSLKIRLRMITPDFFFWFICLCLLGLQIGAWPYPQHSEIVWDVTLVALSMSLALLQIRAFIDEHHRASSTNPHLHLQDRDAFNNRRLNNFMPQPVLLNHNLLPLVKSGMRQLDSKEHLHDHLSVIQQHTSLPLTPNSLDSHSHLWSSEETAALVSTTFNLRILGHEILQKLENLCHQQQTPLLFAIKPDTHTHLIGAANAFVLLLQYLTKHSLQFNSHSSQTHLDSKKTINTISVRIEDETLPETDYPNHQNPLLLKSHVRDTSCLNEEHIHWLNQSLDKLTDSQIAQLLSAYPHLISAKHWVEQLQGKLHIHLEGSATTCYSTSLLMQSVQIHQPEPPQSFLTLKDKKILLMTYDGEYGMTMTEQASSQDIPMSLALSISQARRNLQYTQHTDAQFDLLVLDCSQAEETLHAFISEIHSTMPGYAKTPMLLLHKLSQTLPPLMGNEGDHVKHATKSSAFVQLGALITGLLSKPLLS